MSRGLIFWVLMLIWFVFAFAVRIAPGMLGGLGQMGDVVLFFILFLLLGWQVYGPPVHE